MTVRGHLEANCSANCSLLPSQVFWNTKEGGLLCFQCLAGVEGLAILTSADFLLDIHRLAVDNDIEPSTSCVGGWKVWAPAVRFLGQGHLPPGSTGAPCCCRCGAT